MYLFEGSQNLTFFVPDLLAAEQNAGLSGSNFPIVLLRHTSSSTKRRTGAVFSDYSHFGRSNNALTDRSFAHDHTAADHAVP